MATIKVMGKTAFLVDFSDSHQPLQDVLVALARTRELPEVVDIVPAATTLLVRFGTSAVPYRAAVERALATPTNSEENISAENLVEIPVRYDGEDLGHLATALGLSSRGLIDWHIAAPWTAAFGGFAPGFSYLVRPDAVGQCGELVGTEVPVFDVPRLQTPRTKVPAGAVGLAGAFSGVYPIASPGGWQLIGSTDVELWDVNRQPPALLSPGTKVQFVEVGRG